MSVSYSGSPPQCVQDESVFELIKLDPDDCPHNNTFEMEDGDVVRCMDCDMTIVDRRVGVISYLSGF